MPVRRGTSCVLFRRFVSFGEDVTQPYVDALEARGVPHLLVGGKAFHDREEVETIRAALAAIEWPDDELSVFATLRGSLFAIDDEELLEWKQRVRRAPSAFRASSAAPVPRARARGEIRRRICAPIARRAARCCSSCIAAAIIVPVADTIDELLARDARARRLHAAAGRRAGARQRAARRRARARSTRRGGGISFRGFVDELRTAAETAQAAEAPILEEGSDGVRLMTVHKAKGLEFPVVILADLTCKLTRTDASR